MIEAHDADFHIPSGDAEWAEVIGLGFVIPEANITAGMYLFCRPQFGVLQSSVTVCSRDALLPWHYDFRDDRPHLPAPASFSNFTLGNGLTLKTLVPNKHLQLSFKDADGTAFKVEFQAAMPPYSVFDPANPLSRPAPPSTGNFEQSGRVKGTLTLRGREYPVDCWSMLNHGWGLRRDRNQHGPTGENGVLWLHAHFPDGQALFSLWMIKLDQPHALTLVYGYALANGQVSGLTAGRAHMTLDAEHFPVSVELEATDSTGREHKLTSRRVHRSLHASWPNIVTQTTCVEWVAAGRSDTGTGDILRFSEVNSLIAASRTSST